MGFVSAVRVFEREQRRQRDIRRKKVRAFLGENTRNPAAKTRDESVSILTLRATVAKAR